MMDSIQIIDKNKCFSCRSCEKKCPKLAIKLVEDDEGFFYPQIDNSKCINCGLCLTVCPANNNELLFHKSAEKSFALINKDLKILKSSASGGLFYTLANNFINTNGIVFGAAYEDDLSVKQIEVNDLQGLTKLQGSKYVYCDTDESYPRIKELLRNNKKVLFSGSPCQIAGLYKFLQNEDITNLYTVDIVCHGTPSQKLFKKYLDYLGKVNNSKVISYNFRSKDAHPLGAIKFITADGKIHINRIDVFDYYGAAFSRHENYKFSCYTCPFARIERIGDLTMGDFWGLEKNNKKFPSKNGVSVCLLNTEKGKKLFDTIKNDIYFEEQSIEGCIYSNTCLKEPEKLPTSRLNFYKNINSIDSVSFIKSIKLQSKYSYYYGRFKSIVYRFFKKILWRF